MQASKLKKRLNGSTLKGSKVRVEDAKQEKKRRSEGDEDERDAKARKTSKRDKKKREDGVLAGHELEEGRRVKRGWTDSTGDAKKRGGSKSRSKMSEGGDAAEGKKLRFKTIVPPNATSLEPDSAAKKKKQKRDKDGKTSKKKVLVQEFENSKKPTARSLGTGEGNYGALSYEDGNGWVNESGEVIEAERSSRKSKRRKTADAPPLSPSEPSGSVITERIMAQASTETNDQDRRNAMAIDDPPQEMDDYVEPETQINEHETAAEASSSAGKEVHPLEALFKKPAPSQSDSAKRRPKPTSIDTSFSFFDAGAAADEKADAGAGAVPQTPHTRRDLEWRSIRSAAPTPDTAAIGRRFSFPFVASEEDDEGEEAHVEQDAGMEDADKAQQAAVKGDGEKEESAFRKWFYENRGDFNRGWKKRRRDERKRKRQRDNQRLIRRVA